jgi:hypothetical protein
MRSVCEVQVARVSGGTVMDHFAYEIKEGSEGLAEERI